mgnify:FL=1
METIKWHQKMKLTIREVNLKMSQLAPRIFLAISADQFHFHIPIKKGKDSNPLTIEHSIDIPYNSLNKLSNLSIKLLDKVSFEVISLLEINLSKIAYPLQETLPLYYTNAPTTLAGRIALKIERITISEGEYKQIQAGLIDFLAYVKTTMNQSIKANKRDWRTMLVNGLRGKVTEHLKQLEFIKETNKLPSSFQLSRYRPHLYIFGNDSDRLIYIFDFETERFSVYQAPQSLKLFCFSSATALPNGQFVITGGVNKGFNTITTTCVRYNPISNTAQLLPDLRYARYSHTSVYLEGCVYVIGGRQYGEKKQGVLRACERYSLSSNLWEPIEDMSTERCATSAVVWESRIYVFGGHDGIGRLNTIECFSPSKNSWENLSLKMKAPIEAGVCHVIGDGKMVYICGKDDVMNNSEVTTYDFKKQESTFIGKVNTGRVLAKSAKCADKLYIFGGSTATWEKAVISNLEEWKTANYSYITNSELKLMSAATSESFLEDHGQYVSTEKVFLFSKDHQPGFLMVFDKTTLNCEVVVPPKSLLFLPGQVLLPLPNGYILVAGGRHLDSKTVEKSCKYWNFKDNSVITMRSMWEARANCGYLHVSGFVYVVGGENGKGEALSTCERFDLRTSEWVKIRSLGCARKNPVLVPSCDYSKFYCFGGTDALGVFLTRLEVYHIAKNYWEIISVSLPLKINGVMGTIRANNDTFVVFGGLHDSEQYLVDFTRGLYEKFDAFVKKTLDTSKAVAFLDNQVVIWNFSDRKLLQSQFQQPSFSNWKISDLPEIKTPFDLSHVSFNVYEEKIANNCSPFGVFDERQVTDVHERDAKLVIFVPGVKSKVLALDLRLGLWEELKISAEIPQYSRAVGLPDSRIMLVGGVLFKEGSAEITSSVMIYSPLDGSVKSLNPLALPRYSHRVVILRSSIYAIGGRTVWGEKSTNTKESITANCECYTFRTSNWSPAPSMNVQRAEFGVSSVARSIYVFGGEGIDGSLNSVECLRDGADSWELLPNLQLPTNLSHLSAISISYDEVLLIGGIASKSGSSAVLSFNPYTLKLEERSPMLYGRQNPQLALRGNRLFAIGGTATSSSEVLSLTHDRTWTEISSYEHLCPPILLNATSAVSKLELDVLPMNTIYERPEFSKLYIFGNSQWQKIMRLDLEDMSWEELSLPKDLELSDFSVATSLPTGKMLLTGGMTSGESSVVYKHAYMLDFGDKVFNNCERVPDMHQSRYTHATCFLNSFVYCLGGRTSGQGAACILDKCERYHVINKEWQEIAPLKYRRSTAVAVACFNRVYIFGGHKGEGRTNTIERYNELQNNWEIIPLQLLHSIEAAVLIPISKSELVLLGGKDETGQQNQATVYDLERLTAKPCKNMSTPRVFGIGARYKEKIVVLGGCQGNKCESAKLGEWNWTLDGLDMSSLPATLNRCAFAQSS